MIKQRAFVPISSVSLVVQSNDLILKTPKNDDFLEAMKAAIPSTGRRFDWDQRAWIFSAQYARQVESLVLDHFGVEVKVAINIQPTSEMRVLDVRYIGQCKDRGGKNFAFGWCDGQWSVLFPESELRRWFGAQSESSNTPQTFYEVLGIADTAPASEIKPAYRRMARQWHPDVCKEPDAAQRFIEIQKAYEILNDELKRKKYNAALKMLHKAVGLGTKFLSVGNYRSPLRCGYIMCEGQQSVGRFIVEKILEWVDIENESGQVLVTSWPAGNEQPLEKWS